MFYFAYYKIIIIQICNCYRLQNEIIKSIFINFKYIENYISNNFF